MAEEHEQEELERPHASMDLGEHLRTWRLFIATIKWLLLAFGALLLGLLMFRAHG